METPRPFRASFESMHDCSGHKSKALDLYNFRDIYTYNTYIHIYRQRDHKCIRLMM